ncbi:MAG: DUF4439 domain-containing protein [Dermatophilaceae bacterium]|nr:ferritin-like domain-containing protein [Intrasporangiaceae bacterium]
MRPAPQPSATPWQPGRRALLGGALGTAALVLSACDVRLEDDAPPIPLIPTREPIPAESALLWLLEDCRDLAEQEGPHTDLYAEQVAVLRSALFRAGVPIETLDETLVPPAHSATDTSTPGAAPSSSTPDPTPADDDAPAGPETALTRIDDLSRCGPGLFPIVTSLLAQRWAAVLLTGGEVPERARVDAAYLWQFPHLAAGFVEVTHEAVYGFEIVAAQSRDETRESAIAALTDLRRLRRAQTRRAGGDAPTPVFGYPLPFPVDSDESALRLAAHVLSGLTDGYGGLLTTVTGAAQIDTAPDVVGWLGAAAAHGATWGVPLRAFPGTHSPG